MSDTGAEVPALPERKEASKEGKWMEDKTYLQEAPAVLSTRDSLKALMEEMPKL